MKNMPASDKVIAMYPTLTPYFAASDVTDIKQVEGCVSFRQFIADFTTYQPRWVTALYGVRWLFVRLLGMRQEGLPTAPTISAETVPMLPGEPAAFFTVELAQEDHYWLVKADDEHLSAYLCIVQEKLQPTKSRFYVVTLVNYHRWTGPVYFNVIRPFHHLVVAGMMRAGMKHASCSSAQAHRM
jgi:hypothetical protein